MKFNSDFRYDLEVGNIAEKQLSILLGKRVEVKNDQKAHITGNVFIEYESRGKLSGISTSEAEYYCLVIMGKRFILIESNELKKLCRKYIGTNRDVKGGDSNTSKGILLPLKDLISED